MRSTLSSVLIFPLLSLASSGLAKAYYKPVDYYSIFMNNIMYIKQKNGKINCTIKLLTSFVIRVKPVRKAIKRVLRVRTAAQKQKLAKTGLSSEYNDEGTEGILKLELYTASTAFCEKLKESYTLKISNRVQYMTEQNQTYAISQRRQTMELDCCHER